MATKRAQRSALPTLPEEMIWEILLRLPPKSLLRCRAVCKAWRCLSLDRGLLLRHHDLQPRQPLLTIFRDAGEDDEYVLLHYCAEAVDLRTDKRRMVVRFTGREYDDFDGGLFLVHASCDGLLLLSFLDDFYVCNPATRQGILLPPLRAHEVAGLYPHGPSGEYRVLYHRGDGLEKKYYVLTVGSHQARCIERRTSSASVDVGLARGLVPACYQPPVLLRGSLHWPPQRRQEDNILVFDTVAEAFKWMCPPVIREYTFLFEMEGKLAMSCCEPKGWSADLWLMEDYKNEIWVREYRIKLPVVEIRNLKAWGNTFWDAVIVSQEGDMLVECLFAVLHCDKKGKLQRTFYSDGRSLLFSHHVLKESLVPHAFLQMQQDGGAGGLPFFRGL